MAHFEPHGTQADTFTEDEIFAMACVLTRRYRDSAADVARDFAGEHEAVGDAPRAAVWNRVARLIAKVD